MLVSWTDVKQLVDTEQILLKYIERANEYALFGIGDGFQVECAFDKGSTNAIEFEASYLSKITKATPRDSKGHPITQLSTFTDSVNVSFAGEGEQFSALAGQVSQLYKTITATKAFNGVHVLLRNHAFGDKMDLLIESDGTGPYGPVGTILNTFGLNWNVDWEKADQSQMILPYRGVLTSGMRINIKYNSVGGTNVDVLVNFFFHHEV